MIPISWSQGKDVPTHCGQALWDFDAPLATSLSLQVLEEPSPATELRRARLFAGLRQRYVEICREVLGLAQPPADSIDRWLLEQLAQPRGPGLSGDPLLPKPRIAETSRVLLRELLAEVPLRCPTRVFGDPALKVLHQYHGNAKRWLGHLKAGPDLCMEVEALGEWITDNSSSASVRRRTPYDCPFRQKLNDLTDEHGLSCRFRPMVEPLALQVINVISSEAQLLVATLQKDTKDLSTSTQVVLETAATEQAAVLRFEDDTLSVSRIHLLKLRSLYEVHHPHPGLDKGAEVEEWEETFRRRLYVMLRRYVTFIGLDPAGEGQRGGNMHAAAPESVFAWLKSELGVCCESFASPLNCYFPRFFSAFLDVDAPFGSMGSFFHVDALPEGSYEVGPPYTEEVLELTARRLLVLLQRVGAFSFVLFVPDWEGCGALNLLGSEAFAPFRCSHGGAFVLARGREHRYISGVQFFANVGVDSARRYYIVPHGTRIYVLQNSLGSQRWPFTEARQQALLERMRPLQVG